MFAENPVRDWISVEKQDVNFIWRAVRYAIFYCTHFVPDGTILMDTSLFYRYFVPKGTFSADVIFFCLML